MRDDDDILEIDTADLVEEGPNTPEAVRPEAYPAPVGPNTGDEAVRPEAYPAPVGPDTGDEAAGIRPLLDISLEDLSDEAPAPAGAFPAVTDDQLLAAANSITLRTLCSTTGQPFDVRYVEDKPGVFVTAQVAVPEKGGEAGASPYAPTAPTGQVEGTFEVSPDYACPGCGSTAVLVCGNCGVDLCAGNAKAHAIVCPNCHSQIQIGGKATSATGLVGKGKGKGK